jgi:threonine dehydrogenase-like Zn-dependent dehydrogenase
MTRAAVIAAAARSEVVDAPGVDPGPGEVRVAVEGCGVCGSNLPVWEGRPWFTYPLPAGAPGHEAWGEVAAVGDGVAGVAPGQRVAVLAEGAFTESLTVPATSVVPLPAALDGRPFPGEAFGSAFNVAARSGFGAGQTVAVVGIGFVGAVVTALAAAAGARVVALSRRPFSLEVARAMGAAEVVTTGDGGGTAEAAVRDLVGDDLCPVVVEAVGSQAALDLAGALTGVRGRLVVAGFHQDGPRTVELQDWNWRGIDVVNAHERDPAVVLDGIRRAAAAVAAGDLDLEALVTHRFPLDRLGDAMEALRTRPDGFVKGVVTS